MKGLKLFSENHIFINLKALNFLFRLSCYRTDAILIVSIKIGLKLFRASLYLFHSCFIDKLACLLCVDPLLWNYMVSNKIWKREIKLLICKWQKFLSYE